MGNRPMHVWEGVLDAFPESDQQDVWESEEWVSSLMAGMTVPESRESEEEHRLSPHSLVHEHPLPPVLALLMTQGKPSSSIRVLDFGGGMGNGFLACTKSLVNADLVEFHIVESRKVCERGRKLYRDYSKSVYFHSELPPRGNYFDIVHVAAALHYIRDWRATLKQLAEYNPRVIMLNALNAGDIPTFVSFQNYYGHRIPVWFWNIREILDCVKSLGYKLVYKSLLEFPFFGQYRPLPMENFHPVYRLERKCNLMFVPYPKE